jgi:predicted HTH transcriptional regulator
MAKKKIKKSEAEPVNKTRLLLKLKKMKAFNAESALSLRELGFPDKKKYEKHLDLLESEKKVKKIGSHGSYKYWAVRNKVESNKKGKNTSFLVIWIVASFIIIFLVASLFG